MSLDFNFENCQGLLLEAPRPTRLSPTMTALLLLQLGLDGEDFGATRALTASSDKAAATGGVS